MRCNNCLISNLPAEAVREGSLERSYGRIIKDLINARWLLEQLKVGMGKRGTGKQVRE